MKNYEPLNIEIEMLDKSDVISTSEDVTTGDIVINWGNAPANLFEL